MPPSTTQLAHLTGQQDRVRALVRALLSDEHAAEDVLQEAWVKTLEGGPRDPLALGAWFTRVARRLALNRLRSGRRRDRRERVAAREESVPSSAEIAARVELQRRLVDALESLPEPHRSVLRDRYLGELTPNAIARRDGLPLETVRSRLARARKALRARLADEAFEDGEAPVHWSVALVPLARDAVALPPAPVAALTGLAATSVGALLVNKLVAVAVAALALVLAWQAWPDDPESVAPAIAAPALPGPGGAEALVADRDALAGPAGDDATRQAHTDAAPESGRMSAAATTSGGDWIVRGRVKVAGIGEGVPPRPIEVEIGVHDGTEPSGEPRAERTVRTATDGTFTCGFDLPEESATIVVRVGEPDYLTLNLDPQVVPRGEEPHQIVVHLAPLDATLTGTVRAPGGAPVAGAVVHWNRFESAADATGRYRIDVAARWIYHVRATAEGYGQAVEVMQDLESGETAELDFALTEELRIRGAVRDEHGAPVAGATVRTFYGRDLHATTDENGEYELRNLPRDIRDDVHVFARKSGYVQGDVRTEIPADGLLEADIVLARGTRVAGRVVDGLGQPIARAEVWIGFSQFAQDRLDRVTDDEGRFEFEAVGKGPRKLAVNKEGYAQSELTLDIPEGAANVPDVLIELGVGRSLSGVVRDTDGEPIDGMRVAIRKGHDYVGSGASTGRDGRFEVVHLPDGALEVEVYGGGWVRVSQPVDAAHEGEVEVVMQRAGIIAGQVVDGISGEPLTAFSIRFVRPILEEGDAGVSGYSATWAREGQSFNDPDGRWSTEGEALLPGAVIGIEASAPGYAPAVDPHVVVSTGNARDELLIELWTPVALEVHVSSQPSAEAVGGARVTVTQEEHTGEYDHRWTSTTDAGGACVLEGVAPGQVWATIEREAHHPVRQGPFTIEADAGRQNLELSIHDGAALVATALDDGGRPSAGTHLRLIPLEVEGLDHQALERRSDADGLARFDGLPPGLYQLSRVLQVGEETCYDLTIKVRIEPPTDELAVSVRTPAGGGTVTGALTAPFDLPAGIRVSALPHDGEAHPSRATFVVDGRFEFAGLVPDTYTLSAMHFEQGTVHRYLAHATVEVTEDGRLEVDLELVEWSQSGR